MVRQVSAFISMLLTQPGSPREQTYRQQSMRPTGVVIQKTLAARCSWPICNLRSRTCARRFYQGAASFNAFTRRDGHQPHGGMSMTGWNNFLAACARRMSSGSNPFASVTGICMARPSTAGQSWRASKGLFEGPFQVRRGRNVHSRRTPSLAPKPRRTAGRLQGGPQARPPGIRAGVPDQNRRALRVTPTYRSASRGMCRRWPADVFRRT